MLLYLLEKSGREIYLLMLLDISGGGLIPESMGKGFSLRAFRPVEIFPQLADGAIFERLHGVDGDTQQAGDFLVFIPRQHEAGYACALFGQGVDGGEQHAVGFLLHEQAKHFRLFAFRHLQPSTPTGMPHRTV